MQLLIHREGEFMATVTFEKKLIINEEIAKKFVELNKYEPVVFEDDVNDMFLSEIEREELAFEILNSFE